LPGNAFRLLQRDTPQIRTRQAANCACQPSRGIDLTGFCQVGTLRHCTKLTQKKEKKKSVYNHGSPKIANLPVDLSDTLESGIHHVSAGSGLGLFGIRLQIKARMVISLGGPCCPPVADGGTGATGVATPAGVTDTGGGGG
jgi:hypothetical protein